MLEFSLGATGPRLQFGDEQRNVGEAQPCTRFDIRTFAARAATQDAIAEDLNVGAVEKPVVVHVAGASTFHRDGNGLEAAFDLEVPAAHEACNRLADGAAKARIRRRC